MSVKTAATDRPQKEERRGHDRASYSFVPAHCPAGRALHLQQTIGNREMLRLLRSGLLQAKFEVSRPNDVYERDADRVGDQVMRMPAPAAWQRPPITPLTQRKNSEACDQVLEAPVETEAALAALRGGGQALPGSVREFMEPRFGADFSDVRIHTGSRAAESARAVQAHAFTVGRDLVFGAGQYAPETEAGKRLLAHELTHVVQQSPGDAAQRISRASFAVGAITVNVDYGNLIAVVPANYNAELTSRIATWTATPAYALPPAVSGWTEDKKRWLLYALDVLVDNTTAAHGGLNRADAVDRLINRAPAATTDPLGAGFDFEREVLRVGGWFEVALAAPLTAPTGATLTQITELYNPPPSPTAPAGGVLDAVALQAQLLPVLTAFLNNIDPASWPSTGTQALPTLQTVGDKVKDEARSFFSPYADTAVTNAYSLGWQYSANLYSVTATAPTQGSRISYLLNRAKIVGGDGSAGPSLFSNVNYDDSRPADRAELLSIVTAMETTPAIQAVVNRLLQHTGVTSGAYTARRVGVSTEYNSATQTECQARWRTIDTLSHELVHVLVHPRFNQQAGTIGFSQIVREGFTEVLGKQLYNDRLRPKAASEPVFKGEMEAGIPGAPCPAPPAASIGYRQAGANAETIRQQIGNDNFRAAYFLGATNLAGL